MTQQSSYQNGTGTAALTTYASSLAGPQTSQRLDQEEVTEWIQKRARADQGKNQCVMFSLSHDDKLRGRTGITHFVVPKKISAEEQERLIADGVAELDRASWRFAATYPDMQRFFVGAHLHDNVDEAALAEWPFNVSPPPGVAASYQRDNEPDLGAALSQLQRLTDKAFSLLCSNMQADKDRLLAQNNALMEQNERLLNRRMDDAMRMEELLDQKSLRGVKEHEARMRLDLEYQIYKGLGTYGVALLKRFTEKGDAPPKGDPMLDFAKTLEPKQLLTIMNELTGEQQEQFKPIASAIADSMTDEKKQELAQLMFAQGVKPGLQ